MVYSRRLFHFYFYHLITAFHIMAPHGSDLYNAVKFNNIFTPAKHRSSRRLNHGRINISF